MRIRQILINLLGNAIKFTEKGSVGVECVLIEKHFFYQKIRISVWDTGIGMDPVYIKRLFDKFSQEDITIARKYGGSGLGMAISYELLQLMGGTIFTHSEKGIGTRFDIELTLPISSQEAHEEAIIPTEINHLAQKRVLLVEDNELNRLVASNTLAHYKIEIVEATNGLEAIEALKKEGFDVILMDLQMPIMDGLTATRIIRSELQLQIPIIALTANAFKSEIDKCKAAGMNDYITKPFEEKILIKTIERALNPLSISLITPTQPVALSNTEALYNLQAITAIGNGDKAFLNKYIHLFITQSNNALQQLKNHYANGDWNEIKNVAHSIKSSMLMLQITGAMPEIMLLEAHESHALAATEIGESIERLRAALHAVIEQLSAELTA
jgi:CheY-like chemotaxis protein/HPt (histidine-containing phosphotransfer) domain-containing protein